LCLKMVSRSLLMLILCMFISLCVSSSSSHFGRKVKYCHYCNTSFEICTSCSDYNNACFNDTYFITNCCGCSGNVCGACLSLSECNSDVLSCDSSSTTTSYEYRRDNSSVVWISIVLFVFFLIFIIIAFLRARHRMKMLKENNENNVTTTTTTVPGYSVVGDNSQQPYGQPYVSNVMPQIVVTNPNPQFSYVYTNNGTNNGNNVPQYILTNTGLYVHNGTNQQPGMGTMNFVDPNTNPTYYSNQ